MDLKAVEAAVKQLLFALGEDPEREGLLATPDRVARAYQELLGGYSIDPVHVLSKSFAKDGYDEMVVLREVDFYSLCEHHLLPFYGTATVAYIPKARVVGLSKLARVVEVFARRLQIQERMTAQIAQAIQDALDPIGYGVIVKARHLCMCSRGVGKPRSEMVTSALGGALRLDPKARMEFLQISGW